jgi:hypothetical protein
MRRKVKDSESNTSKPFTELIFNTRTWLYFRAPEIYIKDNVVHTGWARNFSKNPNKMPKRRQDMKNTRRNSTKLQNCTKYFPTTWTRIACSHTVQFKWDSSVSIVTGLWDGQWRISGSTSGNRNRLLSSAKRPERLRGPPSRPFKGYRGPVQPC